jgi:crotonobetainyl-CoA:carnitine CoA-transferase CaiB-like acyl-CoA transferase
MMGNSPLSPLRVIDTTDHQGLFCGRILADLGFDVVKVERPGGDESRRIGPFYHDEVDGESSLYWYINNLNKRGITLNIEVEEGKKMFRDLANRADIIVESYPPGYMDGLGLGYKQFKENNPGLIFVSISPFGQDGPYAAYRSSDIVNMAMGGLMNLIGDPDRPPLRVSLPQSFTVAGVTAAMATMAAYYWRTKSGEGQHVDVSIQASIASALANVVPLYELSNVNLTRQGSVLAGRVSGLRQRTLWKCKDGYQVFFVMAGEVGKKTSKPLVAWMDSEGMAPDYLLNMNWDDYDLATADQELQDSLEKPIAEFCLKHTKAEFFEKALETGMTILPVSEPRDIVDNPQLKARGFWLEVEHPEKEVSLTYPGFFAKFSESPCELRYRAPLIGEHNEEIYLGELGLSETDLNRLRKMKII